MSKKKIVCAKEKNSLKERLQVYIEPYKADISVAIKNFQTQEEILLYPDQVFPAASTIKLLILATFLQKVKDGEMSLTEKVYLKEYPRVQGDGILKELSQDIFVKVLDLLTLMIILSDNLATNICLDKLGTEAINQQAKALGLPDTLLRRKMMDHEAAQKGQENLTTARDLLRVLEHIEQGTYVDEKTSKMALQLLARQQVPGMERLLPEGTQVAHKTGDLQGVVHDVGIISTSSVRYAICILTKNLSSNLQGKEIIAHISKITFDAYTI